MSVLCLLLTQKSTEPTQALVPSNQQGASAETNILGLTDAELPFLSTHVQERNIGNGDLPPLPNYGFYAATHVRPY